MVGSRGQLPYCPGQRLGPGEGGTRRGRPKKEGWGRTEECSLVKGLGFEVVLGPGKRTLAWRGVLGREVQPRERMGGLKP